MENFKCYVRSYIVGASVSSNFSINVHKHWKLLGLAAVVLIASTSTVYAYWRITTTPSSPTLYVTASYPPLELRVQLDKADFTLGEKIAIHLFLRNLNDWQVNVTFSYLLNYFDVRVLDKKNTEVFSFPGGWQTEIWEETLAPYGQLSKIVYWDQIGSFESGYYKEQVPTGTYKIVGSSGYILQISQERFIPAMKIEAPPLQITINS